MFMILIPLSCKTFSTEGTCTHLVLSCPFKEDRWALPMSMPLPSRGSMVSGLWLWANSYCLKLLNTSDQTFSSTPAGPGQYMHMSLQKWLSKNVTYQSGLLILLCNFCKKFIESVKIMACVVWLNCHFLRIANCQCIHYCQIWLHAFEFHVIFFTCIQISGNRYKTDVFVDFKHWMWWNHLTLTNLQHWKVDTISPSHILYMF